VTPIQIARARRDKDANAMTERELATARLCNFLTSFADEHGLPAAMAALDQARAELAKRRSHEAKEAGWIV
jgi:hypothetical protein